MTLLRADGPDQMQLLALAPVLLRWRSPTRGWLAALMLFLLALTAQIELMGILVGRPFLLFVPAVLMTAVLGGWLPAAAVAVASAATVWLLFLPPPDSSAALPGAVSLPLFLLLCAVGIALVEALVRCAALLAAERARSARLVETHRVVLRELQHRMANHIQFVSAVLALQARGVEEVGEARLLLRETGQRLETLARIHRRLCEPAVMGSDLARLVQEISQDLLTTAAAENIVCVVDVVPVELEPERLTVLALIITELLTNALKHAFLDRTRGTIAISLRQPEPGLYALEVRDDGVGMVQAEPAGSGLGMRILRSLSDRMGGSLSIRHEDGTVARLEFPELLPT